MVAPIVLVGVLGFVLDVLVLSVAAPAGSPVHSWYVPAIALLIATIAVYVVAAAKYKQRWAVLTTDRVFVTAHTGGRFSHPGTVLWEAPRASVVVHLSSFGTVELQQSGGATTTLIRNVMSPTLAREFVARFNETRATTPPGSGPTWV